MGGAFVLRLHRPFEPLLPSPRHGRNHGQNSGGCARRRGQA
jgi:hypothetical protein